MLGWMLKRGDASNAVQENDDTSQVDQPDTPAPVFAARAFKTALFGSPSRRHQSTQNRHLRKMASYSRAGDERLSSTPSKPPGILLTPGTGTARRKRVSFGNEPADDEFNDAADQEVTTRKRSRLTEVMNKASTKNSKKSQTSTTSQANEQGSSDEWEEDDDEDYSAHDMTIDLNEPHSQSGKYWKAELQKYQTDAKAEMEKLLKYKQLAKTYAHQKDDEVIRMAERLKEEQQRVIQMEQMIAANTSDIASKQQSSGNSEAQTALVEKLSKQSTLAVQYRERVQELEEKLEDLLLDRELQANNGRRRQPEASPSSQKTLLETQRELRHARNQVKEMGLLREQLAGLKDQLKKAKSESRQRDEKDTRETPRARELRAQLRDMQHETKLKDEEMTALKAEFEAFRKETEVHDTDMRAVLERAHNKIADLKKEVKTLKTADGGHGRPKSWHAPAEQDADKGRGSDDIPTRERRSYEMDEFADDYHSRPSKNTVSTSRKTEPEKAKWQPFVPRTPRERRYAGEAERRAQMDDAATTKTSSKPRSLDAPSLPAVSQRAARESRASKQDNASSGVDLLRHRFARLGGPEMGNDNQRNQTASRSVLPPERRAAALARIEKRMAEKKRARARTSADKENVWP